MKQPACRCDNWDWKGSIPPTVKVANGRGEKGKDKKGYTVEKGKQLIFGSGEESYSFRFRGTDKVGTFSWEKRGNILN